MNMINIRHISEKAWYAMSDGERITLFELAARLNINVEIAALAIGWLAAEDKVYIHESERTIELSSKNRHPIYFG